MSKIEKFLTVGVVVAILLSVFAVYGGSAGNNLQGKLSPKRIGGSLTCTNDVTQPTILFTYDGDDAQFSDIYSRARDGEFKCNYEFALRGAGNLICDGRDIVASSDGKYVNCIKHIGGLDVRASIIGDGVSPAGMMTVFYGNTGVTTGFVDTVDIYQVPFDFSYSAGTGR